MTLMDATRQCGARWQFGFVWGAFVSSGFEVITMAAALVRAVVQKNGMSVTLFLNK
jgi:hypothetical protein